MNSRLENRVATPRRKESRPIDVHVGQRIRERRSLLGVSRNDLAKSLGLSIQQIQKYESGDSTVSASRLYELAVLLDVSPSYFFENMPQSLPHNAEISKLGRDVTEANPQEIRQMATIYQHIQNPGLRHNLYELARAMARNLESNAQKQE